MSSALQRAVFWLGVASFAMAVAAGFIESHRIWGRLPGIAIRNTRLGDHYAALHDYRRAALEFGAAQRIDRDDAVSAQRHVAALDAVGDGPGVLAALEEAGRQFPYNGAIQSRLVELLAAADRPADALVAVDRLAMVAPMDVDVQLNRGNLLMTLQRPAEAIDAFQQTILLDPAAVRAHFGLGAALTATGRHDAALTAYARVLELAPTFVPAYLGRGLSHASLGRYEEAREAYEEALALDPEQPAARRNLAEVEAALAAEQAQ